MSAVAPEKSRLTALKVRHPRESGNPVFFARYPEYKDSGIAWLGEVPAHWEVARIKASIASCRNGIWGGEESGDSDDIPCVRVADFDRDRLVVDRVPPTIRNVSVREREGRLLNSGNLLLEKSGGGEGQPVGCVVLYDCDTSAVCSNFVARMELRSGMVPSFWRYVHAAAYSIRLTTRSINQTSGIQNLDQDRYFNERAAFPPVEEQSAIAVFLDRETPKIDELIAKQEKLIVLLKEKRQALISLAVTRGLDPNAPTKDSGIEWLGQVPAHWNVARLKLVADVQTGVAKGKDYGTANTVAVPYLRVANVQDGYLDLEDVAEIEVATSEVARYELKSGDVLMNEGGDFDKLGRGAIWHGEIAPCIHQNHVFAVRPHAVRSAWLNAVTGSDYAQFYFMGRSKQSTNLASISSTNLMELPVVLPPDHEQENILAFVDQQSDRIDALVAESSRAIELLKERRTALISAAVTGKIRVFTH